MSIARSGPGSYQQLPGNSNAQRAAAIKAEPQRARPVISGASLAKPKKENAFLADSAQTVWESIVANVIVPGVKQFIESFVTTGLRGLLYGSQSPAPKNNLPFTQRNGTGYVTRQVYQPYQPQTYQRQVQGYAPQQNHGAPPEGVDADIGDIYVASEEDARALSAAIVEEIREYGQISACRLADLAGLNAPYTGHDWGWFTKTGMNIVKHHDGTCRIVLPAPVPLK